MKKIVRIAAPAALALSLAACGHTTTDDISRSLDAVDAYISDRDYSDALRSANRIFESDTAKMSASQLGRLAIAYMEVSDGIDDQSLVVRAGECYRQALAEGPDSVASFAAALSPDRLNYLTSLDEIVRRMDGPRDIPADEPIDSIDEPHIH